MASFATKAMTIATYTILVLQSELASASPLASRTTNHALGRRQAGTYDGTDNFDGIPTHAGTFDCFRDEFRLHQSELTAMWDQACTNTTSIQDDDAHFSYVPNPDNKTYPLQSVTHQIQNGQLHNETADGQVVSGWRDSGHELDMTAQFHGPTHATTEECQWVMQRITAICHGENGFSRGGWWEFADDKTTYGIDPLDREHGEYMYLDPYR